MLKENGDVIPIFTLSTIGNREYRWRKDNAIVSWTQRSGSKNLRAYIVGKLSEDGRTNNTTRELANGLTKEEIMEAERPNKGAMMSKAGKKLIPDEVRERRENKPSKRPNTKRRSTKRKASENSKNDHDNENEEDDQQVSQHANGSKVGSRKTQKRKEPTTMTKTLRKRKAPANFDDNSDVEGYDCKRIKLSSDDANTCNDGDRKLTPSLVHNDVPLAAAPSNIDSALKRKREADTQEEDGDGGPSLSPQPRRLKTGHSRQKSSLNDPSGDTGLAMPTSTLTSNESDYLISPRASLAETQSSQIPRTATPPPETNILSSNPDSNKTSSNDKSGGSGPDEVTATADTTSASSSSTHSDPVQDFRFEEPKSFADAAHIEEALILTRHSFTDLHGSDIFGEQGPMTNFYDSYAAQYRVLQKESASLQIPGLPIVYLDHWGAWNGGFDKWKATKISREDFLQGMVVEDVDKNLKEDVPFSDELFEEFEQSML